MKQRLLPILVVGVLAAGLAPAAQDRADENKGPKAFEGTWVAVFAQLNGKQAPKEALKDVTMTFAGEKFTLKEPRIGRVVEGTFRIDPSKSPREYSATAVVGGRKLTTVGIYELDGDTLKICYTPEGGNRPAGFSTKGGTAEQPVFLTVYRRQQDK